MKVSPTIVGILSSSVAIHFAPESGEQSAFVVSAAKVQRRAHFREQGFSGGGLGFSGTTAPFPVQQPEINPPRPTPTSGGSPASSYNASSLVVFSPSSRFVLDLDQDPSEGRLAGDEDFLAYNGAMGGGGGTHAQAQPPTPAAGGAAATVSKTPSEAAQLLLAALDRHKKRTGEMKRTGKQGGTNSKEKSKASLVMRVTGSSSRGRGNEKEQEVEQPQGQGQQLQEEEDLRQRVFDLLHRFEAEMHGVTEKRTLFEAAVNQVHESGEVAMEVATNFDAPTFQTVFSNMQRPVSEQRKAAAAAKKTVKEHLKALAKQFALVRVEDDETYDNFQLDDANRNIENEIERIRLRKILYEQIPECKIVFLAYAREQLVALQKLNLKLDKAVKTLKLAALVGKWRERSVVKDETADNRRKRGKNAREPVVMEIETSSEMTEESGGDSCSEQNKAAGSSCLSVSLCRGRKSCTRRTRRTFRRGCKSGGACVEALRKFLTCSSGCCGGAGRTAEEDGVDGTCALEDEIARKIEALNRASRGAAAEQQCAAEDDDVEAGNRVDVPNSQGLDSAAAAGTASAVNKMFEDSGRGVGNLLHGNQTACAGKGVQQGATVIPPQGKALAPSAEDNKGAKEMKGNKKKRRLSYAHVSEDVQDAVLKQEFRADAKHLKHELLQQKQELSTETALLFSLFEDLNRKQTEQLTQLFLTQLQKEHAEMTRETKTIVAEEVNKLEEQIKRQSKQIETLQSNQKKQFENVKRRLEQMNIKIDSVDGKLVVIDEKLDDIDGQLSEVELEVEANGGKLDNVLSFTKYIKHIGCAIGGVFVVVLLIVGILAVL